MRSLTQTVHCVCILSLLLVDKATWCCRCWKLPCRIGTLEMFAWFLVFLLRLHPRCSTESWVFFAEVLAQVTWNGLELFCQETFNLSNAETGFAGNNWYLIQFQDHVFIRPDPKNLKSLVGLLKKRKNYDFYSKTSLRRSPMVKIKVNITERKNCKETFYK
ncbi:hypothetical protein BpHYR1_035130 [Brachionus plicatilis]|uniref:Uncharacterized protein n=1 Tax=Brachionus plicatilis TaxID=10195 RepID=A0A3M7QLQ9_BRAPC|nr:hypothetical protein BpHYR1_035130 [Brachionus plicatilis]